MNSKGQITIFAIIGIILLLGAGIFFYIQSQTPEELIEGQTPELQDVGEEYRPVANYVSACLTSIGIATLEQIGQHGGYLRPLEQFETDMIAPYDGDGLFLTRSEQTFVPYWMHIDTPTEEDLTIYPTLRIPDLEDIAIEQAIEIDNTLLSCLNNFTELEYSGAEITILEEPTTTVTYTFEEVIIQTTLPLTVQTTDGATKDIESFYTIMEIPFKRYYNLARQTIIQEYENQYLENLLTTLISYYSGVDANKLPPFYGVVEGYTFVNWVQADVKQKLQTLLLENIPLIQVQGTNNSIDIEGLDISEQEKDYLRFLNIPLFGIDYPELEVYHHYFNWPIYSKVWPTEGEILGPKTTDYPMDIFGSSQDQTYNFFYDVSYPVIIEIREENAYLGNDYSFFFAMEANIRKNYDWRAYENDSAQIVWTDEDMTLSLEQEEEQFDALANKTVNIDMSAKKLFGNKNQFVSQPLKITTMDYLTGRPLEGVKVDVGIGTYTSTNIGKTTLQNGEAIFQGQAPIMTNGYVTIHKQGYLSRTEIISLDNSTNIKDLGRYTLFPKQSKYVDFKIIELFDAEIPNTPEAIEELNTITNLEEMKIFQENMQFADGEPRIQLRKLFVRNLTDQESLTLTLNYVPLASDSTSYSAFTQSSPEMDFKPEIELVPGRYEIEGMLFDNEGIIIPAKSKKICNGDDCDEIPEDKQYIPEEPIEMIPAIWGGIHINSTLPWFISAEDLYAENNMTFYLLKFPQPKSVDSLQHISNLEDYSQQYRTRLVPQLTN